MHGPPLQRLGDGSEAEAVPREASMTMSTMRRAFRELRAGGPGTGRLAPDGSVVASAGRRGGGAVRLERRRCRKCPGSTRQVWEPLQEREFYWRILTLRNAGASDCEVEILHWEGSPSRTIERQRSTGVLGSGQPGQVPQTRGIESRWSGGRRCPGKHARGDLRCDVRKEMFAYLWHR